MLLTISLVLLLVHFVTLNGGHLVPNAWKSFVEIIYDFVLNLVNEQISVTSHFIITLGLSLSLFIVSFFPYKENSL
ncbi:hypothetical protein KC19_4G041200 [Ceratodon purpureus]|uniref:F-ATPase protein 6 n=1 Tax=Ceratodon purpureus TaxID=3225 RepID=A0A8T0I8C5_CERPU|nr:hypothetical protein KC19_4G041200 [Ceratodon purpureus]